MKKIFFLILIFTSCKTISTHKNEVKKEVINNYTNCKVYKIDSINNYYLVYAISEKSRYKIVSRKEHSELIEKIKINSSYNFEIKDVVKLDSISHKYANYLDFKRCHIFFPSVEICNEPSIELYETNNLIGLYYKK